MVSSVREFVPVAGGERSRNGGPVSPEIRREILDQVAAGRRAVEVAREYGVHHTSITRWKAAERAREEAASRRPTQPAAEVDHQRPPRATGRYSKVFKEDVLGQLSSGRKVVEVARQYQVPEKSLYRWVKEARAAGGELPAPRSTRPPTNASPIDEAHRALVLDLKKKHPNMGPAQIQNQLKRFQALKISRHLIGRIFSEAGIPLEKRSGTDSKDDPAENRFEMSRPNELWAVDFKEFWIHSEKVYALFLLDDFSRFCLGFALTGKPTADLAIETIEAAIQRYGRPERVLSDRGPQFHAWNGVSRLDEFLGDFLIDHSVTKAKHAFTNGKMESFNRSLEDELLYVEEFASVAEAEVKIRDHITRYNFFRTHMGINGLIPADRYFGMVAEAQRAMAEGLRQAGPRLTWLRGIVSENGTARRQPTLLQIVLNDGKLELVVLGRRFTLG